MERVCLVRLELYVFVVELILIFSLIVISPDWRRILMYTILGFLCCFGFSLFRITIGFVILIVRVSTVPQVYFAARCFQRRMEANH